MDMSDVIRAQRRVLGLSQADLAKAAGVSLRQLARYEAGEQQPVLSVAVALAETLQISLAHLAGQVDFDLTFSGDWWASWQTWMGDEPRIDTHPVKVDQRDNLLRLDADRALPVEQGSYRWRGELRLWDNEALIGWYRSTDAAVRSKGSLYLAVHRHGTFAWGRWVGMSYDGDVVTGWGVLARAEEQSARVALELTQTGKPA